MNDKTLKICRILAGVAMVMMAVPRIVDIGEIDVDSIYSLSGIIFGISSLLIAVGLFSANTALLGAGCIGRAICWMLDVIWGIEHESDFWYILTNFLVVVGFVLVAVSLFYKKNYVQFFVGAVIISSLGYLALNLFYYDTDFKDLLWNCSNFIAEMLLSNYLPIMIGAVAATVATTKASLPLSASPIAAPAVQTFAGDTFGRINKLKDLLDVGAITKEEFEQKKKEFLNL